MARFVADFLPLKGTDIFDMSGEMAPQLRVYLQVPPEFDESYFKYNEGGSNIERKTFFENQDKLKELLIERYRSVAQNRLHAARRNKNNGVISVYKQNIDLDNGVTMEYVSLWGREYVTLTFAEWLVRRLLEKIDKKGDRRIVIFYGSNQYAHASIDDFNRLGFAAKFTHGTAKKSSWAAPSWWAPYETLGVAGGWFISTVQMKFSDTFHPVFFKGQFVNGIMNAEDIIETRQPMFVSDAMTSLHTQVRSIDPVCTWHGDSTPINGQDNKVYDKCGSEYSTINGKLSVTKQGEYLWLDNWFSPTDFASPADTSFNQPFGFWFRLDVGTWTLDQPRFNYMGPDGGRYGDEVVASHAIAGHAISTKAQANQINYNEQLVWSVSTGPDDNSVSYSGQDMTEFEYHFYDNGALYSREKYYPSASVSGSMRIPRYTNSGRLDKIEYDTFPISASTSSTPIAFAELADVPTMYYNTSYVSALGTSLSLERNYGLSNMWFGQSTLFIYDANPFPGYVGRHWVGTYRGVMLNGPPYQTVETEVRTANQTITFNWDGISPVTQTISTIGLCHCSNGKRVLQVYAIGKVTEPGVRYAYLDGVDVTDWLGAITGGIGEFRAAFLDIKLSDLENIL